MTPHGRNSFLSFLVSACIITAPFLAGAALLITGIGVYRAFNEGPKLEPAELGAAWGIIGPAWALFATAIVLSVVGFYSWRRLQQDQWAGLPEATKDSQGK